MSKVIISDDVINHEKKSKLTLWLVLSTLILPMLLAYVFFHNQGLVPKSTSNKGELIDPLFSIRGLLPERKAHHRQEWVILNIMDNKKNYDYATIVNNTKNVHIRLGKDAYRVQRMLLPKYTIANQQLLTDVRADTHLNLLPVVSNPLLISPITHYHTVIIDPNGYAVLGYHQQHSASDLLKDIKRLLKFSYEQYSRG